MEDFSGVSSGRISRDFSRLWVALGASAVGSQISELAVPLLAVVVLHASAGEAGLLGAARWLPFLVLALPLGVLIDRRRRRPVLVTADLARALLTVGVVVLAASGTLTLPLLIAAVTALGACTVAFEVGYQSFLPTVAGRDQLERANGRLQAHVVHRGGRRPRSGRRVGAGPDRSSCAPCARGDLPGVGPGARAHPTRRGPAGTERHSAVRDLRDGLDHVRRDRYLVSLVGFAAIYNLFAQWILVLFTVHAVRELGMTAGQLGTVLSLGAVGAVVGAALAPHTVRRWGAGPVLVTCAAVECVALAVLPIIDPGWPIPLIMTALVSAFALNGAGTALSSVVALTLRQLRTPDHLLGRVNATMRWLSYGVIAIGAALGGVVGDALGTRVGIAIGCAGILLTVVWVACSPLRSVSDPQSLRPGDRPLEHGSNASSAS